MGEQLGRSAKRKTLVYWPEAIDERLDALLQLATEAGEQTSRAQILAALVANAPLDGEGIGVLVRAYRREEVDGFRSAHTQVRRLDVRRPGPRVAE